MIFDVLRTMRHRKVRNVWSAYSAILKKLGIRESNHEGFDMTLLESLHLRVAGDLTFEVLGKITFVGNDDMQMLVRNGVHVNSQQRALSDESDMSAAEELRYDLRNNRITSDSKWRTSRQAAYKRMYLYPKKGCGCSHSH